MVKYGCGCLLLLLICGLFILLPLSLVIGWAHWLVQLLLVFLLTALIRGTFRRRAILVLYVTVGGKEYLYPDMRGTVRLALLRESEPELREGDGESTAQTQLRLVCPSRGGGEGRLESHREGKLVSQSTMMFHRRYHVDSQGIIQTMDEGSESRSSEASLVLELRMEGI